jgi:hypothetical protein
MSPCVRDAVLLCCTTEMLGTGFLVFVIGASAIEWTLVVEGVNRSAQAGRQERHVQPVACVSVKGSAVSRCCVCCCCCAQWIRRAPLWLPG